MCTSTDADQHADELSTTIFDAKASVVYLARMEARLRDLVVEVKTLRERLNATIK